MRAIQIVKIKTCLLNDMRERGMRGALHYMTSPGKWGINRKQHQHRYVKETTGDNREETPRPFPWKHRTLRNPRGQPTFGSFVSLTFLSIPIELPRIVGIRASLFSSIWVLSWLSYPPFSQPHSSIWLEAKRKLMIHEIWIRLCSRYPLW